MEAQPPLHFNGCSSLFLGGCTTLPFRISGCAIGWLQRWWSLGVALWSKTNFAQRS